MSDLTILTIKLPNEIKQKVSCKLCGEIIKDENGLIILNDKNEIINGMCFQCEPDFHTPLSKNELFR